MSVLCKILGHLWTEWYTKNGRTQRHCARCGEVEYA